MSEKKLVSKPSNSAKLVPSLQFSKVLSTLAPDALWCILNEYQELMTPNLLPKSLVTK